LLEKETVFAHVLIGLKHSDLGEETMNSRIDYTKASPAALKAMLRASDGGQFQWIGAIAIGVDQVTSFSDQWLRLLHRFAFSGSQGQG
jgi:hypothetical protein